MIAWGHTAVGAAIGLASYSILTKDPQSSSLITTSAITFSSAIASHYLCDFIPHGHLTKFKNYRKELFQNLFFDVLLSITIFLAAGYYFSDSLIKTYLIALGIFGSLLPDIIDGLIYIKLLPKVGLFKWELNFHTSTHWHGAHDKGLPISIIDLWQLIVVISILLLIIRN